MTLNEQILFYQSNYSIVDVIDLTNWQPSDWLIKFATLKVQLESIKKFEYDPGERIIFIFDTNHYGPAEFEHFIEKFIKILNQVDISVFFAVVLVNNNLITQIEQYFKRYSVDSTQPTIACYTTEDCTVPLPSDTFCVIPWIHLSVQPYQKIATCCAGESTLGTADQITLKDAWNSAEMCNIRHVILTGGHHTNCARCYEQEKNGVRSQRQLLNDTFEHLIPDVKSDPKKFEDNFKLRYIDLRFTNLCNIRCRTCNHHSSSKWYQDQVALDPKYDKPIILKAGKTEFDMWEQLEPHIDQVEHVYFAGGEPLVMEEHYKILDKLEQLGNYDVKLSYNTNFLQTKLKKLNVFSYWKKFKNVSVMASLDGSGVRGEYIRKDINWSTIENNRQTMIAECPDTIFKIGSVASILNMWHLVDFHREWIEKGLVQPQNISVSPVQTPHYYRVDVATHSYKLLVKEKIMNHIAWLQQFSNVDRTCSYYTSLINFMFATDNSKYLTEFWEKTNALDIIRSESVVDVLPELKLMQ